MKINIILLTYARPERLSKQLESLEEQTLSNNIILHIINNNPKISSEIKNIVSKYKKIEIKIIERNNETICFERFYYVRENLLDTSFVIFIDDDQIYSNNQIEELVNKFEYKTFCTWYGRVFDKNGNPANFYSKTPQYCLSNEEPQITEFHYGGPGFSIIDTQIFNSNSILWDFENWGNELKQTVYKMDDIMLSWTISKLKDWKIKRSFNPPHRTIKDKKAISKPLNKSGKKAKFVEYLNNLSNWV
jgi:hypothetical protein